MSSNAAVCFLLPLFAACVPAALVCGARAFQSLQIVDAHEHIQSAADVPKLLRAMRDTGIGKMVLLGSPRSVFFFGSDGFHDEDANNLEVLRIAKDHPGTFLAFPTVDVDDPQKVEKLLNYFDMGALGLKLYAGSTVYHTKALDDSSMLPLYEVCERRQVPIVLHVNAGKYQEEFERVLIRFPHLKVLCPHFCMSTIASERFESLMDGHPQLYTDISFGYTKQLNVGLKRFSKNPSKYRRLVRKYQDRVLFGTDMVVSDDAEKNAEWITRMAGVYRDLLERDEYTFFEIPGEQLRGLHLDPAILNKIYRTNFESFLAPHAP